MSHFLIHRSWKVSPPLRRGTTSWSLESLYTRETKSLFRHQCQQCTVPHDESSQPHLVRFVLWVGRVDGGLVQDLTDFSRRSRIALDGSLARLTHSRLDTRYARHLPLAATIGIARHSHTRQILRSPCPEQRGRLRGSPFPARELSTRFPHQCKKRNVPHEASSQLHLVRFVPWVGGLLVGWPRI